MKLTTLTSLMLAIVFSVEGQRVTISTPTNSAMLYRENRYIIQSQNLRCSEIVVKASGGTIVKNGCALVFIPDSLGRQDLQFYKKTGHGLALINTIPLWTTDAQATPMLGVHFTGLISKKEILAVGGVLLAEFIDGERTEVPIHMDSFRIVVIRGDSAWSIHNVGARFSAQSQAFLQMLQSRDKLFIVDIKSIRSRGACIKSESAEFTIE